MSRSRNRKNRRVGFTRREMVMTGTGVFVLYGGLTTYMMTSKPTKDANSKIGTCHVILFDNSDKYSDMQTSIIKAVLIEKLKRKLQYDDRLTLYQLTDKPDAPLEQLFSEIMPKRGVDVITALNNPHNQEQIWQDTFWQPYVDQIEQVCVPQIKKRSPILEGIYELSREFPFLNAGRIEFTLVSDCLQNASAVASAYNGSLYANGQAYTQSPQAQLSDVDCRVLYMKRRGKSIFQTEQHRQWLHDYFDGCQAKSMLIESV